MPAPEKNTHWLKDLRDVEEIERTPLVQQHSFQNTYDIFVHAAKTWGSEVALQFLLTGADDEHPFQLTYAQLLAQITRTANLFHRLGIGPTDVVADVLPNLPQTHYVIWGGEAAGIVAAVNPFLESSQIAELLRAVKARVLVTLAPAPEFNLWEKVEPILSEIPSIETVLQIDVATASQTIPSRNLRHGKFLPLKFWILTRNSHANGRIALPAVVSSLSL